jgi:hypothetical protein
MMPQGITLGKKRRDVWRSKIAAAIFITTSSSLLLLPSYTTAMGVPTETVSNGNCTILGQNILIATPDIFFVPSKVFSPDTCCDLCAAYPGCGAFTQNTSGCALKGVVGGNPPVRVETGSTSALNPDVKPLSNCSVGFTYGAGKCWFVTAHNQPVLNWSTARNFCASKNAHLAEIYSPAQNKFVLDYVGGFCAIAWMGADCQGGEYYWRTTGQKVSDGWPNFAKPSDAKCMDGSALAFTGKCNWGYDGRWVPVNASSQLRTYLCSNHPSPHGTTTTAKIPLKTLGHEPDHN